VTPEPAHHADRGAAPGVFRRIGERDRHDLGFLSLVTATFVGPDGFTFERDIVRHPGAVCVVPLDDAGRVVCVRQYRGAIDRYVLEIPAGKMDVPDEPPAIGAARELAEEVGLAAESLEELGSFFNSPGFTDERTYCYLAEGLTDVGQAVEGIEEQYMTIERVPLEEIFDLLDKGEMVDGKTIVACFLAKRRLEARAAGGGAALGTSR
jgi:ADP-ribose pyrophosphatase